MERIELIHPIQFGSVNITYFEMPEKIQARHMRSMPINGVENYGDMLNLIQAIFSQPHAVIDCLDPEDVEVLGQKAAQLVGKNRSRPIGSN